jgi:3-dehydroquinate dehydratase/shikimate dehydrogenase
MATVPAGVYKLATRANGVGDLFAHFGVLGAARAASRRAVAIAMGPKGFATRVLGPAWGADFTFCAPDAERGTAPGQAPLVAMRDLYRVDELTEATLVTGLVAGTAGYSLSPAMHNAAARDLGVDLVYVPFEAEDLATFLAGVRSAGWRSRGFSVTNPFKTEALELVDEADALARRAGAVNTIVVDGRRLVGYNTDVEASVAPLEALVGALEGVRVGVVGAGGAARALVCGLAARGARVAVFARRADRARAVAEPFGATAFGLDAEPSVGLDVLVNATPVGTTGLSEGDSPVPSRWLAGIGVAYDLVYAPERTRFLAEAEAAGCRTLGGLPMLAAQAARQFELWTGEAVEPSRLLGYVNSEQ